jgi:L-aspartate oxidase
MEQPLSNSANLKLEKVVHTPHLVIGTGIAGLGLALKLAKNFKVHVIAKSSLTDNNTYHAQGGIASVLGNSDHFDNHVSDTLDAGAGLCQMDVVRSVVESGPALVKELIDLGVNFTENIAGSDFHLTQEGGHSHRRVLHAADLTGREIMRALIENARAHKNITILEDQMAIDLLTTDKYAPNFEENICLGAYVLHRASHEIYQIRSEFTHICTGGNGRAYLYTSNPNSATGDGLAMGWRAGCRVANLEFMQFHPTCLFHAHNRTFLISEAVRGEGGILKDRSGRAFMKDYHEKADLAPRDIVARAIDTELKKSGDTNVFLDVRHLGEDRILKMFPGINSKLKSFDVHMEKEMIPVVPAAHYNCGGIVVNKSGWTGIKGLYALGESACTGLHGANRLASNSLLEALVYADRVAAEMNELGIKGEQAEVNIPDWNKGKAASSDELGVLNQCWDEIRRVMWHYVGIVRSDKRLVRALNRISTLRQELDQHYWEYEINERVLEVRNLALVAELTIKSAMARKESRGIHYNIDHPETDNVYGKKDTILR